MSDFGRVSTVAALGLATLILGACAGGPAMLLDEVRYREPDSPPAPPVRSELGVGGRQVLEAGADALEEAGFALETVEPDRGLLIVRYSGGPEGYVNCGEIRGDDGWQPAAATRLDIQRFLEQPNWRAMRQMRLDARIINRLRTGDGEEELTTRATYVLTRTVDTIDDDGRILGSSRETIHFESGGVGRFAKGTRCHPTGELERGVAGLVEEAAAAAEGPAGLVAEEEAPAPAPTPTELPAPETEAAAAPREGPCPGFTADLPPGACDILRAVERVGVDALPGFEVSLENGLGSLGAGEPVVLDVTLPGADRYFHVGYIQEDGTVQHLGPRYIDAEEVGDRFVYRTGYAVSAPHGTEAIVALASPEPVPGEGRPAAESAANWFESLTEALDGNPGTIAARHIIVETGP